MKSLILVRHAKSDWTNTGVSDSERPLNKRGERDAPYMGQLLAKKGIKPDLVISSPALRCKSTVQIFSKEMNILESAIKYSDKLYAAGDDEILAAINKVDDNVRCLMVVGHNPGMTDLVNMLTDEFIDNIPTAGIVSVKFDENKWSNLRSQSCKFEFYEYPKKYFPKGVKD